MHDLRLEPGEDIFEIGSDGLIVTPSFRQEIQNFVYGMSAPGDSRRWWKTSETSQEEVLVLKRVPPQKDKNMRGVVMVLRGASRCVWLCMMFVCLPFFVSFAAAR